MGEIIKMDLSIQMRITYNVKHHYVSRLKFGGKFLTFLTKLALEEKEVALQSKKMFFFAVVSFQHLLSLS